MDGAEKVECTTIADTKLRKSNKDRCKLEAGETDRRSFRTSVRP